MRVRLAVDGNHCTRASCVVVQQQSRQSRSIAIMDANLIRPGQPNSLGLIVIPREYICKRAVSANTFFKVNLFSVSQRDMAMLFGRCNRASVAHLTPGWENGVTVCERVFVCLPKPISSRFGVRCHNRCFARLNHCFAQA